MNILTDGQTDLPAPGIEPEWANLFDDRITILSSIDGIELLNLYGHFIPHCKKILVHLHLTNNTDLIAKLFFCRSLPALRILPSPL